MTEKNKMKELLVKKQKAQAENKFKNEASKVSSVKGQNGSGKGGGNKLKFS